MGLSPACGLPAFTNMVLALKEGHGSNVTHGCVGVALTYASRKKEDSESLKALAKHSERYIRIVLLCVPMFIRTQVSKEDVRGDDHVRVVTVISISVYYPFLLNVRVDGSGVNPRASICFNASADAFAEEKRSIDLRRMIWRYFVLLIGEGALRKWILPSLGAPLLVIRDPLVLLIYLQAVRCRRFL